MPSLHRHGALALLAVLVLTTGCGPQLDLRSSSRLEALLPSPNAYPDGFDVDELDVEEIEGVDFGGGTGTDDFDDVEPAECGAVLNGGAGRLPAGAVEGAAQTATPSGSSSGSAVYGYVLVSGDFGDAPVEGTGFGHLLDTCSRMSLSTGGARLEGALVSRDSPALPEGGGMFSVTLYGERTAMAARTAWGQVGDVYFVLVGMSAGDSSDVSSHELVEACPDEIDMDCMDSHRVRMATEENERMAEDFEEVLSRAVEKLERAA